MSALFISRAPSPMIALFPVAMLKVPPLMVRVLFDRSASSEELMTKVPPPMTRLSPDFIAFAEMERLTN